MILYLTLENYLEPNKIIPGLKEGIDYKRTGSSIFFNNVKPGIYGDYEIRKYYKLTTDKKYPEIELKCPCPVGRYNVDDTTFDVVFGRDIDYDKNWKHEELLDYLEGEYGYWDNWTYGLKNANLANIVMELIKDIPEEKRLPWYIVRYITAMSDASNNENGVLFGRWDGKYKDGENPSHWKSVSHVINHRYITGKPVKYGQCWIFAEVLTATFRFLGIPARTVYALNSHIDCGMDKGIDMFETPTKGNDLCFIQSNMSEVLKDSITDETLEFDIESDQTIQKGSLFGTQQFTDQQKVDIHEIVNDNDSAWNFHVWSEAYVSRKDLEGKCDWQICDPCPVSNAKNIKVKDEFHSKHFFGPCPISSIKENNPDNYDHAYLYSAVNSLWRYWTTYKKDDLIIIYPYDINYKTMNPNIEDHKRVLLFTRNPFLSINKSIVKENITWEYRYKNPKLALESYHKDFPFVIKTNDEQTDVEVEYHKILIGKYLIQICYLKNNKMITCHRKIYKEIKNIFIPKRPYDADVMSILCVNLETNEFYPQIL